MRRGGIHRQSEQSSSLTRRLSRVDELRRFQARLSRELGHHLVFGAGPPPGQMGLRGRPHWPTSLVTLVTSANDEAQSHRLPLLCGPALDRIQKKLKNTEGGGGRAGGCRPLPCAGRSSLNAAAIVQQQMSSVSALFSHQSEW